VAAVSAVRAQAPSPTASPAHARLFAPPARAASFDFARTDQSVEAVAQFYRVRWPAPDPRSWKIERLAAAEAFDGAALFDRARVARQYAGRHPRVARGPLTTGGDVTAVVLLMSPYPEPDLSGLNAGTLVMTVRLAGADFDPEFLLNLKRHSVWWNAQPR
jgi:hypothetical protein